MSFEASLIYPSKNIIVCLKTAELLSFNKKTIWFVVKITKLDSHLCVAGCEINKTSSFLLSFSEKWINVLGSVGVRKMTYLGDAISCTMS